MVNCLILVSWQVKSGALASWVALGVMTYVYVVGELSHFLLGIVSRPMSQELHYGDQACLPNPEAPQQSGTCRTITNATRWVSRHGHGV